MYRTSRTWTITNALQEIQSDGHHMRPRVITCHCVGGDLIGIGKIKLVLH